MFLGFENLFCLQMCLDSFILNVNVRLYLSCFGLKITICLMWRMREAITRKKSRTFFQTYLVSTSVLHISDRFFINYFICPQHEDGYLTINFFVGRTG